VGEGFVPSLFLSVRVTLTFVPTFFFFFLLALAGAWLTSSVCNWPLGDGPACPAIAAAVSASRAVNAVARPRIFRISSDLSSVLCFPHPESPCRGSFRAAS
jgi:hypothetical protein